MAKFDIGDLVVLKSGSMRMVVEEVSGDVDGAETIQTVWCNEGVIGRDRFSVALLNKWEHREDSRPAGGGDRPRGGGKPYGGDREGGGKPYRGGGDRDRAGDREGGDRPPRKTGWDGKPREKKFYRKEG